MVKEGYYFGVPPLLAGGAAILLHWWLAGLLLGQTLILGVCIEKYVARCPRETCHAFLL